MKPNGRPRPTGALYNLYGFTCCSRTPTLRHFDVWNFDLFAVIITAWYKAVGYIVDVYHDIIDDYYTGHHSLQ